MSGVSRAREANTTIRQSWLPTSGAVLACLAIGLAAALPFAGHAGLVSRFDIGLVPEGCELNDFSCSTARQAFWLPVLALLLAGCLFGAVAATRVRVSLLCGAVAALISGTMFVAGALVTQATVGDNPIAMRINELLGTATLDEMPVWIDVARQFGMSVGLVAAAFTLVLGLVIRPRRAVPAALVGGLVAGFAFALTTWLLDQVVGITIVGVGGGPNRMPVVALVSNLVAGVAGSGAAMAVLTRGSPVPAGVAARGENPAPA